MAASTLAADAAAWVTSNDETNALLDRHLASFANGIDAILADYVEASILITPDQNFRGLAEIRSFFQAFLDGATPEFWAAFTLEHRSVEGDVAYITWSASPAVKLATDTVVVRGGKVHVQTFTALG